MPVLADNRKALHDYELLEEMEVGIVLTGQEVKSIKNGGLRLRGSYGNIHNGSLWLVGAYIAPYKHAGTLPEYDPQKTRQLLAHKREIQKIVGRLEGERLTIVPKTAYTHNGRIKISLWLARGKRDYEKRAAIRSRETKREISRALKEKR